MGPNTEYQPAHAPTHTQVNPHTPSIARLVKYPTACPAEAQTVDCQAMPAALPLHLQSSQHRNVQQTQPREKRPPLLKDVSLQYHTTTTTTKSRGTHWEPLAESSMPPHMTGFRRLCRSPACNFPRSYNVTLRKAGRAMGVPCCNPKANAPTSRLIPSPQKHHTGQCTRKPSHRH